MGDSGYLHIFFILSMSVPHFVPDVEIFQRMSGNLYLLVVLKVNGSKSVGFVIWAPLMSVPACFTAFHPAIKTFQYGPKWWGDQQTDIKIPRAMLLVGLKRVEALSYKNMLL